MRLIVVRHGETEYNKEGRLMGHRNIGLNRSGREQAKKLAARIASEKIDYIYSSDLDRCLQTLEPIQEKFSGVPVYKEQQLRERNIGVFEGKRKGETSWDDLPGTFLTRKPQKGESLADMKGRINRFLRHLKDRHLGEGVLLVTHGGVMRIIHHLLTRESLIESFNTHQFENTAVSIYDMSSKKPQAFIVNDTSHL